jgi:replicative DNA helicase
MSAGKTSSTRSPIRLVNLDGLKGRIAAELSVSDVAEKLCDVELVDAGHQRKGLCPLHQEDTPSFHVNDAKGAFHCFGCKAGGDSIALVQQVHHVDFLGALALLADAAGVDLAEYTRPATPEEKARDELADWCERWLATLKPETSRVNEATAQELGVLVPRKPAGDPPPALRGKDYLFRGQVVFPYRAASGRLVGWKVREPDKKMFKTPNDFPLTEPVVWGLDVALPHVEDELIVVEGEYDCAVMHDYGITNVAAMGGSKWTDEQMAILVDHKIRRVVFLLDGDEAGREAAEGISRRFWRHEKIQVRVVLSWAGADPEDMLRAMGADVVRQVVANARGGLEYLLFEEWAGRPRISLTDKLDFVAWVQAEYGEQLTGVQQTLVMKEVAVWLDLPETEVLDFARASQTLLQAPDSERVVLGRCVRDLNYYVALRKRVAANDFFVLKHQRVWRTLEGMLADGLEFDVATVRRRAADQGVDADYVDELAATGELNIGWHEDQVIDYSIRRQARADADHFRDVIGDLSVPANQLIGTLTHSVTSKALGRGSGAFVAINEQVDEAMDKLLARAKNPGKVVGVDLGSQFPTLNRSIQGWQRRRLVLVGATSGRGKSTLTLQICVGAAVHQAVPTDFISLEMDADEILFKVASHMTGIDSLRIAAGEVDKDEIRRVERALARVRRSPLRIYPPDGITPNEFLLYAREAVMERRTELFVLDYAQMVGPDPDTAKLSRYEQLGRFAYLAKQKICRGLDTTVIACAQLKREAASKEEPSPEDMGDSYELVRAADVILLINENDNQQHELWIGKNRQGPNGVLVPAHYDKPTNTFYELSGGSREPDYRLLEA